MCGLYQFLSHPENTPPQTKELGGFKKLWGLVLIEDFSNLLWLQPRVWLIILSPRLLCLNTSPHLGIYTYVGLHFSLLHIHQLADIRQTHFYEQLNACRLSLHRVWIFRGGPRAQWTGQWQSLKWPFLVFIHGKHDSSIREQEEVTVFCENLSDSTQFFSSTPDISVRG